ncbi:polysaccharide lyase family 7 protein [Cellulophaga baltica]|uniref:polysaccharide lyase family 7 protein n=1 Tax=Cellulophaga TaxID=104264 RepID=UPI001C074700|nr:MULTISPECIES: polysaccharide lyase family 7 protein [Cellulophaga]MBU2997324.1 polysaccharide lyase family 7 protein [Cellulophaga baltica]MDO6768722.1 polysaccharide lyase family 7 protein [Cellulophaga sp. 1_MG-2023]
MKTSKNVLKTYKRSIFYLTVLFLVASCSTEESSEDFEVDTAAVDATATTIDVDFGNLVVETSWISGDKSDRDTFTAGDVDGEEWMDIYTSGVVMMTCLSPDGHRTELKEDSGHESSLETYKKMSYTALLEEVPEHGITVAQIHNRGGVKRPWIRVYIDSDNYIKIKATATTPDEDSSTYDDPYVGPKYTDGDDFSVEIITDNGEAFFEISTDGSTYTKTLSPSSAWDDYDDDFYLKAGVYTEGDNIKPKMKMSNFSIEY